MFRKLLLFILILGSLYYLFFYFNYQNVENSIRLGNLKRIIDKEDIKLFVEGDEYKISKFQKEKLKNDFKKSKLIKSGWSNKKILLRIRIVIVKDNSQIIINMSENGDFETSIEKYLFSFKSEMFKEDIIDIIKN